MAQILHTTPTANVVQLDLRFSVGILTIDLCNLLISLLPSLQIVVLGSNDSGTKCLRSLLGLVAEQAMDIVSHHQLQNRSKLPLPPLKRIHWADDFPYDNRRSMCKLLIQVLDAFMQAGAQLDDVTLDGFTTYQISMEVLKSLAECVTNKRVIMDGQVKELYEIEFALLEWCETEEESLYEGTDSDGW